MNDPRKDVYQDLHSGQMKAEEWASRLSAVASSSKAFGDGKAKSALSSEGWMRHMPKLLSEPAEHER